MLVSKIFLCYGQDINITTGFTMEVNQTKICTRCYVEKDVTLFSRCKKTKSGRFTYCKACFKAYTDTLNFPVSVDFKECVRCKTYKSAAEYCPNRRHSTGLDSYCKSCYRDLLSTRDYPVSLKNKVCTVCKKNKSAKMFYRRKVVKNGLFSYCKQCDMDKRIARKARREMQSHVACDHTMQRED